MRRLRATGLRWCDVGAQLGRDGACCRLRIMRVLREPDAGSVPAELHADVAPPQAGGPEATRGGVLLRDPGPAAAQDDLASTSCASDRIRAW